VRFRSSAAFRAADLRDLLETDSHAFVSNRYSFGNAMEPRRARAGMECRPLDLAAQPRLLKTIKLARLSSPAEPQLAISMQNR
jgi:hypothetical protein